MTRVFLAAGVAALAITAPATAGPRAKADQTTETKQDRSAKRTQRVQQRTERAAAPRIERTQRAAAVASPQRTERVQMRAERQQVRAERVRPARTERVQTRVVERQQVRPTRVERVQTRAADRQQVRTDRVRQVRTDRFQQVPTRQVDRQQPRAERQMGQQALKADRQQIRAERQLGQQALRAERMTLRADNVARVRQLAANRALVHPVTAFGTRVLPLTTAQSFIGVPVTTASTVAMLSPLPMTVQYLYPDTSDYYYRYGNGYMYQVDRSSNLIAALLPLLAGGYMQGSYLPSSYMNSYAPNYYGYDSFYPSSYGAGYGYGYDNLCNRYANGVIYQVDCVTGYIVNVIPTYAGGYGVGQLLPSDYSYYNVPSQYRSMYYDNDDYGYWYAPGAIYQYDRSSSLISSVAALLSPGFSVGQPLPMGYDAYNVPYSYRATYYDTPNAWYRYNNGYIYQVDPTTQLVSAIVASILT